MSPENSKNKYLVIIGDGMADFPIDELHGKTPLMAAHKPNMDKMAREGFCGQAVTVPDGFAPGSDVACMSLFGYDPAKYYTGRAPLEAYAMGITMDETDVVFRCNIVYLEPRLPQIIMGDYSAGHIDTEEARILVTDLNNVLGNEKFRFYPGVGYRHILIWRGGKAAMSTTPPHDISGQAISDHMPKGEGTDEIIKLISDSQIFLKDHKVNGDRQSRGKAPANSIWLWGQGKKPYFPTFFDKHGLQGAVVAAVDLVKGIGAVAGFDTPHVEGATGYLDTDYKAKAKKALELLKEKDIVYVHVEAPDEASHSGNLQEKLKAIQNIDEKVVGFLLDGVDENVRILLATDHATPISTMTHYGCPVPFAIFQKGRTFGGGGSYDEAHGGRMFSGEEMIEYFLRGLNS
jgi:2,3-bisphosphoglycerate-independent phosphoglycerate mutase